MKINSFLVNSILILSVFNGIFYSEAMDQVAVPMQVGSQVVAQASSWTDKFDITLNPVKAVSSICKTAYDKPAWALLAGLGVFFGGYHGFHKFKCYWNTQIDLRASICKLIYADLCSENNMTLVGEELGNCRRWFFWHDEKLETLIDNFYNCKINDHLARTSRQELYVKIVNCSLGKFSCC